jgi:hypothetical protein
MNNDREQQQLEFFGCILASATHQLNNVLSTADQIAGLLGDMLVATDTGHSLDPRKIADIKDRLLVQVQRGTDLVGNLNAFAHCVDRQHGEIELGRLVHQFLSLYKRFASQRRLELSKAHFAPDVGSQGNPLDIQHALFLFLEVLHPAAPAGGRATIAVKQGDEGGIVEVRGGPEDLTLDEEAFTSLASRLATVVPVASVTRSDTSGGGLIFALHLGNKQAAG